jgi:hypothetical protein
VVGLDRAGGPPAAEGAHPGAPPWPKAGLVDVIEVSCERECSIRQSGLTRGIFDPGPNHAALLPTSGFEHEVCDWTNLLPYRPRENDAEVSKVASRAHSNALRGNRLYWVPVKRLMAESSMLVASNQLTGGKVRA